LKLNIIAILAISAALLWATAQKSAVAQQPPQGQLSNPLNLTPSETTKMRARFLKMQSDVQALQANTLMTDPQKKAQLLVLEKAYSNDMMAMLTPTQRARANVLQAQREQAQSVAMARVAKIRSIQSKLQSTMTADQKSKIQAIAANNSQRMQAILGDKTATDTQKRTDLSAAQHAAEKQIMAVLTPAQQVQFQKMEALMPTMAPPPGR
jgi:hypothetical protein